MPRYEIVGTGKDSGRKRKRVYEAGDERAATRLAEEAGTIVSSIKEIEPEPPTAQQVSFAEELGISIPDTASRQELSDLIAFHTRKDKPPSPSLRDFARDCGVLVTPYLGKKLLFERLFDALGQKGRERELAAWFCFRVYRELMRGKYGQIDSPNDERLREIADTLAGDASAMQSVRRYRGADLIWFGRWTSPDGFQHEGGSNRTKAYALAAAMLRPLVAAENRAQEVEYRKAQAERHDRFEATSLNDAETNRMHSSQSALHRSRKFGMKHVAVAAALLVLIVGVLVHLSN